MDKKTVIICLVVGLLVGVAIPMLVNSYERPGTNNIMEVDTLTKKEYRKIIWGLLKEYRDDNFLFIRDQLDDGTMSLVELLNKIMAIPTPGEKNNPYEGQATRG